MLLRSTGSVGVLEDGAALRDVGTPHRLLIPVKRDEDLVGVALADAVLGEKNSLFLPVVLSTH